MANRPVSKEYGMLVHTGSLNQQRSDRTVDIGLTNDREAFIKEQGVCTAGHNAKFILKGVPTLNNSGVATVFLCHRFDRNFHSGYIVKLVLGDVDVHIHSHISDAGFDLRFFLFCLVDVLNQFGHRNGRKLDVEFLKQLTFVAHRAPEVKRTGRDLKDAGMTEGADDIADGKEVLDSPLKFGIGQVAVGHVGERYAETAENLTSREQAALGISQADAGFGIGTFIAGTPEQNRKIHFLGQSCDLVLGAEVSVREEDTVNLLGFEFFHNCGQIVVIVEKPFFIDIGDVNKIHAQFAQTICGQIAVFNSCRRGKDTASGRCITDFDFCRSHKNSFLSEIRDCRHLS